MKAVRMYGRGDLRVEDAERPRIADDEILLAVHSGFICGTDVRMYKNGHATAENGRGLTLGHEMAGVIAEVGRAVAGYASGMRVTVDPNIGCGVCDVCVSGNTQHCPDLRAIGIHLDGCFAEFVRVPADAVRQGNVAVIPDGVSFDEAALVEPLSCVLNAAERCRTQPGETVLVIGAGPIGIMHGMIHRMLGAGKVLVHDLNESRLERCKEIEPSFVTIGPDALDATVRELTNGRGVDVAITAAPSGEAQTHALELLALGGRLMLFGGLPKDREVVAFNSNLIHYKELVVTGTTRQNLRQYRACLAMIEAGTISVEELITHRFELSDAQRAFSAAASGEGLKLGFSVGSD